MNQIETLKWCTGILGSTNITRFFTEFRLIAENIPEFKQYIEYTKYHPNSINYQMDPIDVHDDDGDEDLFIKFNYIPVKLFEKYFGLKVKNINYLLKIRKDKRLTSIYINSNKITIY